MSTATQELTRRELRSRRVTPIDSVDLAPLSAREALAPLSAREALAPLSAREALAPLSAREAIGRSTGMRGVPLAPSRPPLWKSAGVVGLIAVIAAGSLPLAASALDIPL